MGNKSRGARYRCEVELVDHGYRFRVTDKSRKSEKETNFKIRCISLPGFRSSRNPGTAACWATERRRSFGAKIPWGCSVHAVRAPLDARDVLLTYTAWGDLLGMRKFSRAVSSVWHTVAPWPLSPLRRKTTQPSRALVPPFGDTPEAGSRFGIAGRGQLPRLRATIYHPIRYWKCSLYGNRPKVAQLSRRHRITAPFHPHGRGECRFRGRHIRCHLV